MAVIGLQGLDIIAVDRVPFIDELQIPVGARRLNIMSAGTVIV